MTISRIGILTAGGDCPGLNAVVRAATKHALRNNIEVFGFQNGFDGLVKNQYIILDDKAVSGRKDMDNSQLSVLLSSVFGSLDCLELHGAPQHHAVHHAAFAFRPERYFGRADCPPLQHGFRSGQGA